MYNFELTYSSYLFYLAEKIFIELFAFLFRTSLAATEKK